jgi:predicted CoA-binding protein
MKPTLIIGASPRSSSYANKAMHALEQAKHKTLLYNPTGRLVEGREVYTDLDQINDDVHTVTLYIRPSRLHPIVEQIIALKPQRLVFNPGTEDHDIIQKFKNTGIEALEACTLVMLRTSQY